MCAHGRGVHMCKVPGKTVLFHPADPQKKPPELMTLPKAFLPPTPSKLTAYTQGSQKLEDPAGTQVCEEDVLRAQVSDE